MRICYIGNFGVSHSTESHVAGSLELLGHQVHRVQENQPGVFGDVDRGGVSGGWDLVLWTRTGWDPPVPHHEQHLLLRRARRFGVPVIGLHLDRWWGLARQGQVLEEPFFGCDLVATADGDHDDCFAGAGVNHHWLPPAVYAPEAERLGRERPVYRADVAFVGSWKPGYHPEHWHRPALITHLQRRWGRRVRFFPRGRAIRGTDLADLYASVKVVVGDSCLAPGVDGRPMDRYWSDRVPETIGRGGFLLHPHTPALAEQFTPGEHFDTWTLGDFDELDGRIEHWLNADAERAHVAEQGREHVLAHHTYTVRMRQLIGELETRRIREAMLA